MRRIARIAALALALLIGFGLAGELLLRAVASDAGVDPARIREQLELQRSIRHSPFIADPELGTLLVPSRQNRVETPDYSYTLTTDHAGFPNRDPWPAEADVAVLGNTLINGSGVGYEGQFTTLLQRKLGDRSVLNFSLHGGGTEHQLLVYRRFAAPLRPKIVIAAVWLSWEINNSLQFHDWLEEDPPRPDFTEYRHSYGQTHSSEGRAEVPRTKSWRGELRELVDGSYLLRAGHQLSKSLRGVKEPIESVVLEDGQVAYLSARDQKRLMSGWDRPGVPSIRDIFFAPLAQLQNEVQENGGRFVVVLVPCKEELYASTDFPEVLRTVQQARTELAERGIPTLDLYPEFQALGTSRAVFYPYDIHFNALGHQLIAAALARWIAHQEAIE